MAPQTISAAAAAAVLWLAAVSPVHSLTPTRGLSASGKLGAEQRPEGTASPLAGCSGFECVLRYVELPDAHYAWRDTGARVSGYDAAAGMSWEGHVLNVTSQRWLSEKEVSHPLWWHILVVIVPQKVEFNDWATINLAFGAYDDDGTLHRIDNRYPNDPGTLVVNGSNLFDSIPTLTAASHRAAYVAVRTRAAAACLLNVPNGYELFADDFVRMKRAGDFLKAYSYREFLKQPNRPELIDELPVAKAVVRAMDAVADFTGGRITRFGLMGYSKLGTASFITAAADARVEAIAPGSIYLQFADIFVPSQQVALLDVGKHGDSDPSAEALGAGIAMGLEYLPIKFAVGTDAWRALSAIIDPANWFDRLRIPKLFMMAANDVVIPPGVQLLAEERIAGFQGPTTFLQLPNCNHDNTQNRAANYTAAFFRGHLLGKQAPALSWDPPAHPGDGHVRAWVAPGAPRPTRVQRWSADVSPIPIEFLAESQFAAEAVGETVAGSGVFEAQAKAPVPEGSASGGGPAVAGSASFLTFEFEGWPEPGFTFAGSTPLRVSAA